MLLFWMSNPVCVCVCERNWFYPYIEWCETIKIPKTTAHRVTRFKYIYMPHFIGNQFEIVCVYSRPILYSKQNRSNREKKCIEIKVGAKPIKTASTHETCFASFIRVTSLSLLVQFVFISWMPTGNKHVSWMDPGNAFFDVYPIKIVLYLLKWPFQRHSIQPNVAQIHKWHGYSHLLCNVHFKINWN